MPSRKSLLAAMLCAWALPVMAADPVPAYVADAVMDAGRPPGDIASDRERKPAELMAFSGIKPGDKVVDLVPGGGYYTRILSKLVGPKGKVYALVPLNAGAPGQARLNQKARAAKGDDRPLPVDAVLAIQNIVEYSNVEVLWETLTIFGGQFSVPEQVDAVWTSDNYHDLHNGKFAGLNLDYKPDDPATADENLDLPAFNKAVYAALKPGGVYVVVDHAGSQGTGFTQVTTLHRAEETAVRAEILSAGFVLDGESQVLRNPADDHSKNIRDASLRGKTDQYALRFRKPANAPNTSKRPAKNAMEASYGNTIESGMGTPSQRWVSYHADGTYQEFGISGAAVQLGKWYWDAAGHNCMIHQYPLAERQGVVCHTTAIGKKPGDSWSQDNGNGGQRPYMMVKGYVQPKVSDFIPGKVTSQ